MADIPPVNGRTPFAGAAPLTAYGQRMLDALRLRLARWIEHPRYAVADLPGNAPAGATAYCTDETGGAVPVFYDGTDWRRVTDRAVAS